MKSQLQRARAHLDEIADTASRPNHPTDPRGEALLAEYMAAFENSDAEALQRILHRDAVIEMPPSRTWFSGKRTCVAFLAAQALGAPGDWRMLPTSANGQPAAAAYHRNAEGSYEAFGIAVLTVDAGELLRISVFADPGLVRHCGLS
ncbi:nuclear transport factor 2 family protein [Nocardia sp. SYP-A9097]|uniref:nuclear transport factor 2 family protein n=1 Tax=Nocardia sp. SYP-A9097 TaxID=2663237 RepID=UPI002816191F|nr:nuclear transport factor 2 family protein [Nocardia sp. SYP-A9097]